MNYKLLCFVSYPLVFGLITFIFLNLNRGFCITDEAYYLLSYAHPRDVWSSTSAFYLIWPIVPKFFSPDLMHYRVVELFALTLSGAMLAISLAKNFAPLLARHGIFVQLICVPIGILSALTMIAFYPLAASYNTLVSFCLYCASAVLIPVLCERNFSKSGAFAFSSGVLTSVCFFDKFTSGILFALLALFLLLIRRQTRPFLVQFAWGLFGGVFLFFIFIQAPIEWWQTFSSAVSDHLNTHSYGPGHVIQYTSDVLKSTSEYFQKFWWVLLSDSIIAIVFYRRAGKLLVFRFMLVLSILVSAASIGMEGKLLFADFIAFQAVLAAAILLLTRKENYYVARFSTAVVLLIVLPIICSFVTLNNLLAHSLIHVTPWLLCIALTLLSQGKKHPRLSSTALTFLILALVTRISWNFEHCPYGFVGLMSDQHYTSRSPVLKGIKLSAAEVSFLDDFRTQMLSAGFKPGDIVLGFYNLEGLVYILDGRSILMPAFFPDPDFEPVTIRMIKHLSEIRPKRFFLLTSWELTPAVLRELDFAGYSFPSAFQLIGTLKSPCGDPYDGWKGGVIQRFYKNGAIHLYKYGQ